MFAIEHRKGQSVLERSNSEATNLDDAMTSARQRALTLGADNIRVQDANGKVIGVYPVSSSRA